MLYVVGYPRGFCQTDDCCFVDFVVVDFVHVRRLGLVSVTVNVLSDDFSVCEV